MDLAEFTAQLNAELRHADYADIDASVNGLQVGPETGSVEHVAFAVDGAQETFERAADADADVLVVHHGISWGGFDRVTGRTYNHVDTLLENDLALYASHLPLDGHQQLGNAAGVANVLDLEDCTPFGEHGSEYIGQRGRAAERYTAATLRDRLEANLDTGGEGVRVLEFGPGEIDEIAIVTGSGTDWLDEAATAGVDALVTGEGKQKVYHAAKEAGITVMLAGHYATETLGVRALQDLAETEWGLETTFIDAPTGL
ncbi:Nif3-like dinuclear metal center hexameric protein [Natronolimnobius baerhuensis]|uniref:Nif3-like dinuclear metal center hexameric protein n=1 Tax=Natronolimnobius baerhuensis TaxID=253108 RepID=A0A202EAV8_9EURY|nr:Nif3-like dinuclear metal center hexameric protein [Natronolimnobius baerhuensis]OVE85396.1 Nif3-like dinuclear metal center hexameric protein [Natronolimnobius baerhuensis]